MQKVWTQAARPRLSCHNLSGYDTISTVLARRTTSAPARRRLTFKDAFTILLAPVLTTAFVADTSWKDKQRRDWDEKIAAVVAEVERLREREQQLWSNIQQRSIRIGAAQQRRSYTTAAVAHVLDTEEQVMASRGDDLDPEFNLTSALKHATWPENSTYDPESETVHVIRRIQRLVAVKMAIQLVLHVHVSAQAGFGDICYDTKDDPNLSLVDVNGLVRKLDDVTRSLIFLKQRNHGWTSIRPKPTEEQLRLNNELAEIEADFNVNQYRVAAFVERVARSILQSKEAPTSRGYLSIINIFSKGLLWDLAYRVVNALDQGQINMTRDVVCQILWLLGKTQDAGRFERFLKNLTTANREENPDNIWEWWRVNGVQVPVPVSKDSHILRVLIYAALKLDQPHKAEAWASILRDSGHLCETAHGYKRDVVSNFLKYYSNHLDWRGGKFWLYLAYTWFPQLAKEEANSLQRVVLSMLDLCVACGQRDVYSKIIESAAEAQIGVFQPDPKFRALFTPRSSSILREWQILHNSIGRKSPAIVSQEYADRGVLLQNLLRDTLMPFAKATQPAEFSYANPGYKKKSTGTQELEAIREQWDEVFQTQQTELANLREELNQARSLYSSLAAVRERISTSQVPQMQAEVKELRRELGEARAQLVSIADVGAQSELRRQLLQLRTDLQQTKIERKAKAKEELELKKQLEQIRLDLEQTRIQQEKAMATQEQVNAQQAPTLNPRGPRVHSRPSFLKPLNPDSVEERSVLQDQGDLPDYIPLRKGTELRFRPEPTEQSVEECGDLHEPGAEAPPFHDPGKYHNINFTGAVGRENDNFGETLPAMESKQEGSRDLPFSGRNAMPAMHAQVSDSESKELLWLAEMGSQMREDTNDSGLRIRFHPAK